MRKKYENIKKKFSQAGRERELKKSRERQKREKGTEEEGKKHRKKYLLKSKLTPREIVIGGKKRDILL